MTMHIFADGLTKVTFSNGNFRVVLTQNGPDNTQVEAGTLIIPASQAANFVNAMANSLKQLDEQIKTRNEARDEKPSDSDVQ